MNTECMDGYILEAVKDSGWWEPCPIIFSPHPLEIITTLELRDNVSIFIIILSN